MKLGNKEAQCINATSVYSNMGVYGCLWHYITTATLGNEVVNINITNTLYDHYYWKAKFVTQNRFLIH